MLGGQAAGLTVTLAPGATLQANAPALAAFQRAADHWSALFSDPITVTITADMANLGNSLVIGQAASYQLSGSYTQIRNQMVLDAANEPSNGIVASLPTAAQFLAYLPTGFSLSSQIALTKANAKALGFTGLDALYGASDATITFNTGFSFDYDNSNGVTPGTMDFETVAMHEIGHALGFISAVDDVDYMQQNNQTGAVDLMTLDLFRFPKTGLPGTSGQFTTNLRNLTPGTADAFSDVASTSDLSTGLTHGDGRQASHWRDDSLSGTRLGIMDPTLNYGTAWSISAADIRALDLVGWDPVPESGRVALPASVALALAALVRARRRRGAARA